MRQLVSALLICLASSLDAGDEAALTGPPVLYGVSLIALDPHDAAIYAATRTTGLYRSRIGEHAWEPLWTPAGSGADPVVELLVFDRHHPQRLFLRTAREGLLRSTDAGATWQRTTAAFLGGAGLPWFVDVDPDHPGVLLSGNMNTGVYRSADDGATWRNVLSEPTAVLLRSPADSRVVFATSALGAPLRRSDDGGTTWTPAGPNPPELWRVQTVVPDPHRSDVLYMGGAVLHRSEDGSQIGGAIFRSEDSGATWQHVFSQVDTWIWAVAVDPWRPEVLYAGSGGKVHTPGLFRSADAGRTWTRVVTRPVADIRFDPHDPGVVYFGVSSGGGGVGRFTIGVETAVRQVSWGALKLRR